MNGTDNDSGAGNGAMQLSQWLIIPEAKSTFFRQPTIPKTDALCSGAYTLSGFKPN